MLKDVLNDKSFEMTVLGHYINLSFIDQLSLFNKIFNGMNQHGSVFMDEIFPCALEEKEDKNLDEYFEFNVGTGEYTFNNVHILMNALNCLEDVNHDCEPVNFFISCVEENKNLPNSKLFRKDDNGHTVLSLSLGLNSDGQIFETVNDLYNYLEAENAEPDEEIEDEEDVNDDEDEDGMDLETEDEDYVEE